jgi:hypothetical protein
MTTPVLAPTNYHQSKALVLALIGLPTHGCLICTPAMLVPGPTQVVGVILAIAGIYQCVLARRYALAQQLRYGGTALALLINIVNLMVNLIILSVVAWALLSMASAPS